MIENEKHKLEMGKQVALEHLQCEAEQAMTELETAKLGLVKAQRISCHVKTYELKKVYLYHLLLFRICISY